MGGNRRLQPVCCCIAVLVTLAIPGIASAASYVFENGTYLGAATYMPDWSATLARQSAQRRVFDDCLADKTTCSARHKGLRQLLLKAAVLPEERQIKLINAYVNRRRYKIDRSRRMTTPLSSEELKYRSTWSTVDEFLKRGGDCEDYASTKYFLLRELGIPAERLRVVITWDRKARGHHAVLAVQQPDTTVWLLDSDNRISYRRHRGYRYIYAVNEHSVWDHEAIPVSRPAEQSEEATI